MSSAPDSKKAVKRRKEAAARKPRQHGAGLLEELETASLAPSTRRRAGQKRGRAQDEDEARRRRRPLGWDGAGRAPPPVALRSLLLPSPFQLLTSGLSNKILAAARQQRDEVEEEERAAERAAAPCVSPRLGGCCLPSPTLTAAPSLPPFQPGGGRAGPPRRAPHSGPRRGGGCAGGRRQRRGGGGALALPPPPHNSHRPSSHHVPPQDGGYASDDAAALAAAAEVGEDDERALAAFSGPPARTRTLADAILERLRTGSTPFGQPRADAGLGGFGGDAAAGCAAAVAGGMEPEVVAVYRAVGELLGRYKSGKVPKAFKVIPSLSNWEEVLFLTQPEGWTPAAAWQATRLFASNLNDRMAQRFFALVLLPRFRSDVSQHKRLHFALFCALKKATYKPAAFFKGLLLPLCSAGNCSLREAVILSSVLSRTSLPLLHAAAALLKVAEMPYSGTNSFFIRVLLDKKYALPYRAY